MTDGTSDLQGWKDIANYLGKSVRAAQRWEAELGLPVHRMKTANGQTVFARPGELDAWRAAHEVASPSEGAEPPAAPDAPPRRGWVRWAIPATLVLASLAGGLVFFAGRRATASPPADLAFDAQRIVARDKAGRELWSYAFPHPLAERGKADIRRFDQIQRVDLDGDGRREVLAVTVYDGSQGLRNDTLWCFSEDGRLLWSYEPNDVLKFDGRALAGTWGISALLVSPGPGAQRVWLAAAVTPWWPAVVVEVDSKGAGRTVFVQSGVVYSLALAQAGPRPRLWAGGINNEYRRAAAALLDPDGIAVSPQTTGSAFHCTSCTGGGPLEYVLFPRSDVNVADGQPYNRVVATVEEASGRVMFFTLEAENLAVNIIYALEPNGAFEATPTDTYWLSHERLSREGKLTHAVADCPELRPARTLSTWTPAGGWADVAEQPHTIAVPGAASPAQHD